MEFTGERVIPGQVNADLWAEHFSRYALAALYCKGSDVLDIGSGSGYGTAHLALHAKTATGLDASYEAVMHSRNQYRNSNLNYIQASATTLPFLDRNFDVITTFEVIEHLTNWREMLQETRRILRANGMFFVSTPNKDYYNEARADSGPNPYHVHEFTYAEFRDALLEYFPNVHILLQNPTTGFSFTAAETGARPLTGCIENATQDPANAYFFIAVCSYAPPQEVAPYIYIPRASNVLREREHHIQLLQSDLVKTQQQYRSLETAHTELEQHLITQNNWARTLATELTTASENITQLQTHFQEQNNWALTLDKDLKEAQANFERLQTDFEERTRWALSLNAELETTRMQHGQTLQELQLASHQLALITASRWYRLGRKLNLGPNLNPSE